MLLILLFVSQVLAQPSPEVGDSVKSYLERYQTWLDTIQQEDRAWDQLERLTAEIDALITRDQLTDDPEDERWDQSVAFVEAHPEVVERIVELSKRPHIGIPVGVLWSDDVIDVDAPPAVNITIPHLGMLYKLIKVLSVDAVMAGSIGDRDRVLRDLRAIQMLAPQATLTNAMIEHLVTIALSSRVIDLVSSNQIGLEDWDSKELASLAKIIDEVRIFDDAQRLTSYEHWGTHQMLDWLYADSEDGRLTDAGMDRFITMLKRLEGMFDPNQRDDEDTYSFMRRLMSKQILPVDTLRSAGDKYYGAVRDDLEADPWGLRSFRSSALIDSWTSRGDLDLRYAPVTITAPAFSRFYDRTVSAQATHSAGRLLVALCRHRAVHGEFPVSMSALDPVFVGDGFIDPYTGRSLEYKLINGQPLIYSVGLDRDNDKGEPMLDETGARVMWPEFIPLDDLEAMCKSELKSIDGDWILYPLAD